MASADDYPPVMDTAMVAQFLGVTVDTVRRKTREGRIPAHQMPGGRSYMYLKDELLDWIRAQPASRPAGEDATTP